MSKRHLKYHQSKNILDFHPVCITHFALLMSVLGLSSCAKMGNPDGGWYDETPPHVVKSTPSDGSTNVNSRKINIYFNEFITIDNPSEKVVVSPPQLETPEIKSTGKSIEVLLKDSLKSNTTYTVDFSDAISDNNEKNPLGNYTYSFSTGASIDTMQVSGYVLESENLEPIKGILVGLYANLSDTAFQKTPFLRVSRTDSRGHFIIKGVAPGSYRIYALQDADGNYMFNQKSEKLAFCKDVIVPSLRPDVRQDTVWTDTLHIKNIARVSYTHFLPDDIVLNAFTETLTDRFFLKAERKDPDHFTLFFSYGSNQLPNIKGLNFNEKDAFLIEPSLKNDTVTYWLRDTALVKQDSLRMQMQYLMTDSTGKLQSQTDTLVVLAKESYEKRLKKDQKNLEKWQKEQDKRKEKGLPFETFMKPEALKPTYKLDSEISPDQNVKIDFPKPLAKIDTSAIHLYAKHDSLWYRAPFEIQKIKDRNYVLRGEWRPNIEYSLEIDSLAFQDIYGHVSEKYKQGFKVKSTDAYSSLFVTVNGMQGTDIVVQLLDGSDKVVKEVNTSAGTAEFYYLEPGKYYMRLFVDRNKNGVWDTGNYIQSLQAESVYYYPEMIECKAKWDVTESWNPKERALNQQKPGVITKQKPDKEKKIKDRNAKRAHDLGIQYIP